MRLEYAVWVMLLAVGVGGCSGGGEQPIPFNHNLHVTKGALECDSCHEYVFERTYAGLPPVKICMRCHKNETPKNPDGARYVELLRAHAKDGTAVGWKRVYQLPSHVFFSHRRHTEVAEIECATCHGKMAELTEPPDSPVAATVDMDGCIDCHRERNVTVDCAVCHR